MKNSVRNKSKYFEENTNIQASIFWYLFDTLDFMLTCLRRKEDDWVHQEMTDTGTSFNNATNRSDYTVSNDG
jgi:hypothetical protein